MSSSYDTFNWSEDSLALDELLTAFSARGGWPPVAVTHSIAVDLLARVRENTVSSRPLEIDDVAVDLGGHCWSRRPSSCLAIVKLVSELLGGDPHRSQLPSMARPIFAVLDDVLDGVLPPEPDRIRLALAQHLGPPAPHEEVAQLVRSLNPVEEVESETPTLIPTPQPEPDETVEDSQAGSELKNSHLPELLDSLEMVDKVSSYESSWDEGDTQSQTPHDPMAEWFSGAPTGASLKAGIDKDSPYETKVDRPIPVPSLDAESELPRFDAPPGPDDKSADESSIPQSSLSFWERSPSAARAVPFTPKIRSRPPELSVSSSRLVPVMARPESSTSGVPLGTTSDAPSSTPLSQDQGSSISEDEADPVIRSKVLSSDTVFQTRMEPTAPLTEPGRSVVFRSPRLTEVDIPRAASLHPPSPSGPKVPRASLSSPHPNPAHTPTPRRELQTHVTPVVGSQTSFTDHPTGGHAHRPVVRHQYSRVDRSVSVAAAPAARRTARSVRKGDSLINQGEGRGWTVWLLAGTVVGLIAYLLLF